MVDDPVDLSPFVVGAALAMKSRRLPKLLLGGLTLAGTLLIVRDCVVLPQTASSLTYLGAFFISVLISPLFAWLWPALERRGWNPSKANKSAIGLAFAGWLFCLSAAGNATVTATSLGSVWWIVLAYFLIEVGEVALAPIGLAAVAELSVPQVVGLMMGAWWLGTSLSEQVASIFGKWAALDIPLDGKIDFAMASAKYGQLFDKMVWVGLGAAVVALVVGPVIRRWMHGARQAISKGRGIDGTNL